MQRKSLSVALAMLLLTGAISGLAAEPEDSGQGKNFGSSNAVENQLEDDATITGAVLGACERIREKMCRVVAALMQTEPANIQLLDGKFGIPGVEGASMSVPEVAGTVIDPHEHDTENVGVITAGELLLCTEGGEHRLGPGQWYHLVGTYDGNTMHLYFDGALVDSESISLSLHTSSEDLQLSLIRKLYCLS